jgi:hypothetical protein
MKIVEQRPLLIYTVENIEASYIVFFSAIITSTICLLDLSKNGRLLLKFYFEIYKIYKKCYEILKILKF